MEIPREEGVLKESTFFSYIPSVSGKEYFSIPSISDTIRHRLVTISEGTGMTVFFYCLPVADQVLLRQGLENTY